MLGFDIFKFSSRTTRNTTNKKEDGEKEKKVMKGNISTKCYEPDRTILDNSMSTAIQDLNISNKIDNTVNTVI